MKARILIAEDDQDMRELIVTALEPMGHAVSACTSAEAALELLQGAEFDVLLSDHQMSGMTGLELCRKARGLQPNLAVILLTAFGSMELATEALRAGAYDFVSKPVSLQVLLITLERAVRRQTVRREFTRANDETDAPTSNIVGAAASMKSVLDIVARVARTDATVLIQGETGTGKELVAQALHTQSGRTGPFVAINCSAMAEGLLESELFGHKAGAFTDARKDRSGLFVEAHGGTLFLDEIGEMGLGMQSKLLRALQQRTVRPLGGSQEVAFDARIVAATNRDLEAEVAVKRFREDLYYRVNVVTITVPPLRNRIDDIWPLARHFVTRAAKRNGRPALRLGDAVAEALMAHDWPGNVRELENAMERAVALARYDEIIVDDLPPAIASAASAGVSVAAGGETDLTTMEIVEARYIQKVLDAMGGNKAKAARVLGFDRRTLYRKLATLGQEGAPPATPDAPSDD